MGRESRQRRREEQVLLARRRATGKRTRWIILLGVSAAVLTGSVLFWKSLDRKRQIKNSFAAKSAGGLVLPTNYVSLCIIKSNELAHCDIALMNLLCAEGLRGSEDLNVTEYLLKLDGLAKYVQSETDRNLHKFREHPAGFKNSEPYFRMLSLVTVLQQDLRIHYNPKRAQVPGEPIEPNATFFANSKDIFIHGLTREGGTGTCSSMPVFLVAVGRRLGYPLKLVKAKGHLFLRWEDGDRSFNIEGTSLGFNSYPDIYYRTWPAPFNEQEEKSESYLKSLTPAQELAVFFSHRGFCLDAAGDRMGSVIAFSQAFRHEPQSVGNLKLFERAEILAARAGVLPRREMLRLELNSLSIPDGEFSQYLQGQKERVQAMLIFGGASNGEIEGELAVLRMEIANVKAGRPPGPAGGTVTVEIPR